jgi:TonB family protein
LTPPSGVAAPKPKPHNREVVSIADLAAKVEREDSRAEASTKVVSKKPVDDSADTAATTARKNRGHADEAPTTVRDVEEAATTARKARTSDDEAATVVRKPPDEDEAATARAVRPPTNPPPVPVRAKRPLTQPPPPPAKRVKDRLETEELSEDDLTGGAEAIVAIATGATDVATARAKARRPTEPPPPRQSSDDLPRGKFVYPVHRSTTGRILKWGLLAVLAAAGGIAFVKFFLMEKTPEVATNPRVADAAVATAPADATQVVMVEPDAAIPEIVIDVSEGSNSSGSNAGSNRGSNAGSGHTNPTTGHTNPTTGHTNPTTGHTNPTTGHTNPTTGHEPPIDAGVPAAAKPDAAVVATNPIPPSDPTCDEVSCVLEKYARPCCARYKPADTGFKPVAGGLPEELDKSMVRTGVEQVKPRVIACGEKNTAKGTVKVTLTVGPDGVVKDASVAESPAPDLGACVAKALRSAQFMKTKMGGTFTYPFVF